MEINATASSTWADSGKFDDSFYTNEISANYNTGYNSEATALKISTAGQLAAFDKSVNEGKNFSGKFVILENDIDLAGGTPTISEVDDGENFKIKIDGNIENVWKPIGNGVYHPFNGTFDGGTHEIKNMVVLEKADSGSVYAGLFGYTENSTIKDLGITGNSFVMASLKAYNDVYAGGIAGHNLNCDIHNIYTNCNCYAFSYSLVHAGNIAGRNQSGSINNNYATGNIYAFSSYENDVYSGGLFGDSYNSSINNSYAIGDVYAFTASTASYYRSYAGGLVGQSYGNINNSYAIGNVYDYSSKDAYTGGFVGSSSGSISNSYATGNVYAYSPSAAYAGGLVGDSNSSGSISNSYRLSQAKVEAKKGDTDGTICEKGVPLTIKEMTGIGEGRAEEKMAGLKDATDSNGNKAWLFSEDVARTEDNLSYTVYFPRINTINYKPGSEPKAIIDDINKVINAEYHR